MPSGPSGTAKGQVSPFQLIKAQLKWIDLIFEIRDGRAPVSSAHPQSGALFGAKPRLIVLSRQDLAEPSTLARWLSALATTEQRAIALDLKARKGKDRLVSLALELTAELNERRQSKGLLPRPLRACVVGIPNVGKSSFINWLIGRRKAPVGDRPGITRGPQWVRVHPRLELLDTPGILPYTALPAEVEEKLALLNLIPESSYDLEKVARAGLEHLKTCNPDALRRYDRQAERPADSLEELALRRNCLTAGGRPDVVRAARLFLQDLRSGSLGLLMLDMPPGS
ncbi:MAG TPA: ribosome biogenesis GTPase YlqF [Candidatus Obscuribacterales bacterium]